jgi:hypothetical protein
LVASRPSEIELRDSAIAVVNQREHARFDARVSENLTPRATNLIERVA